jgi:hypothetical protein
MANQAFALSPISARANLPSEEDYDAIREAFMETARGRWFLDEYARRNRNADTSMVLDAVARIEETLAAQRRPPAPPPEDKRPEMLAAISAAIDEARRTASTALDGLGLAESLDPIRKGARIIKEISWRWREIGADGRICDLLDSQVGAIEAGCSKIADVDPRVALREAFDTIKASISAFSDVVAGAVPAPAVEDVAVEAAATPEIAAAVDEPSATAEAVGPSPDEPYDDAMLELVALEMAAPDFDDADQEFVIAAPEVPIAEPPQIKAGEPPQEQVSEPPQAHLIAPSHVEAVPAAIAPEPLVAQDVALASPPVASEAAPSLGATILANGLVTRPKIPANDPLAPIRRMTQSEKIAFFS